MAPNNKAAVLERVRERMRELGVPVEGMSDEELERGVRSLAEAARTAGVSPEEAAKALVQSGSQIATERQRAERQAAADAAAAQAEGGAEGAVAGDAVPPDAAAAADEAGADDDESAADEAADDDERAAVDNPGPA